VRVHPRWHCHHVAGSQATMLRIGGAIQVLEESLRETPLSEGNGN
jgi:hypothetical protein